MRYRTLGVLGACGLVTLLAAAVLRAAYTVEPYRDLPTLQSSLVRLASCASWPSTCRSHVPDEYQFLGEFRPTFYRILDERSPEWPREERTTALVTRTGEVIARVSPTFKRHLEVEGSARLLDGRIVNLDEQIDASWRYVVVHGAPFGLGDRGYKLIPYRTLAVDPKIIKRNAVLYVPATRGVALPSGEVHDGFFFAHDTGGDKIRGYRIDIFVGFEHDLNNAFTRSGRIRNLEPVRAYTVDPETASRLRERFAPQFEQEG